MLAFRRSDLPESKVIDIEDDWCMETHRPEGPELWKAFTDFVTPKIKELEAIHFSGLPKASSSETRQTTSSQSTSNPTRRSCAECGLQKERSEYSNNQWRKGTNSSKCKICVEAKQYECQFVDAHSESKESATRWINLVGAITCDADGCSNIPEIRCSRCEMAYYCSVRCKRRHLDEHLDDLCRDVNEMRETNARFKSRESDDASMRGWAHATQLSGSRTFEALLAQAEYIHQADQDWDAALGLYNQLMKREQSVGSPPEWRRLYMGISRCFYEKGIYDGAIQYGTFALEMNRMFPQIHKYIALSQRDSGDLAAAIRTMKEAVLYEAPYDDENKQFNVDLSWKMQGK